LRPTLAEIAKRLGRKALKEIEWPNRALFWLGIRDWRPRGLTGPDGVGTPQVSPEVELLVVRFACENRGCGCDRIVGALANLGFHISDRTVGNILRRHNNAPPERSRTTTWKEVIRSHMDALTWRGLVTYYVLFFIYEQSGLVLNDMILQPQRHTRGHGTKLARLAAARS
jgi:hypothetical protein